MTTRHIAVLAAAICVAGAVRDSRAAEPTGEKPPARAASSVPARLAVHPTELSLTGGRGRQQILVSGEFAGNTWGDLTGEATFATSDEKIARVSAAGLVRAVGNGEAVVVVQHGGRKVEVPVRVAGCDRPDPVDFRREVVPALSRAGCSQGACHGSPQGKQGFRLSLRGYDPKLDFGTLARETGSRRTDVVSPENSLILRKGAGIVPHQGGVRFKPDEESYRTIAQWIGEGCQESDATAKCVGLEVLPGPRTLPADRPRQRLVALARFDDGTVRDVTPLAVFSANVDPAAEVSPDGLVEFSATTETVVLVRYLAQVRSVRLTYVADDPDYVFRGPRPANFVDEQVFARQKEFKLLPAERCDDATFLRRVHLDLTGALPTLDEARAFLDAPDPDKRTKLVDRLLERDEYATFWAMKWADVMRGSRETISERGVHSFHRWLVARFAADDSFADMAREILTAGGNTLYRPAANFHRIATTPEDAAESAAQLFLGVRVQCARCHNHPFEALTQDDYYGLAAYFARVKRKGQQFMVDDAVVYVARNGEVNHPLTRKPVEPAAFGTPAGTLGPDDDRRTKLAEWLVREDNPWFAPSTANRIWFHLLGTGLVEPVDDFRDTNPASHPELLRELADLFVRSGWRIKPVIRAIVASETYQRSAVPPPKQSPAAPKPDRWYVSAKVKLLQAEQILDGISTATGLPEEFPGYPPGTKAVALAEGAVPHHFLAAFSKPIRDVQCDCARDEDPSLSQVLHLLNNAGVIDKIRSPQGRLAQWLKSDATTDEIGERCYLAALSRRPTPAERELVAAHIARTGDRTAALQDLLHALLNSNEFLLRH